VLLRQNGVLREFDRELVELLKTLPPERWDGYTLLLQIIVDTQHDADGERFRRWLERHPMDSMAPDEFEKALRTGVWRDEVKTASGRADVLRLRGVRGGAR
jgi:hypothetical protein